jgi:hypothetical protein
MKRIVVHTSLAAAAAALAVAGLGGTALAGVHPHDNDNAGDGGNTHVGCSVHGPSGFGAYGHYADQDLSSCSAIGSSNGGDSFGY